MICVVPVRRGWVAKAVTNNVRTEQKMKSDDAAISRFLRLPMFLCIIAQKPGQDEGEDNLREDE